MCVRTFNKETPKAETAVGDTHIYNSFLGLIIFNKQTR